MRPATRWDIFEGTAKVYHRNCGGTIGRGYSLYVWMCSNCGPKWHEDTIRDFSDEDLALRFALEEGAPGTVVLVEEREGDVAFVRAVPIEKAYGLKRAKVDV